MEFLALYNLSRRARFFVLGPPPRPRVASRITKPSPDDHDYCSCFLHSGTQRVLVSAEERLPSARVATEEQKGRRLKLFSLTSLFLKALRDRFFPCSTCSGFQN